MLTPERLQIEYLQRRPEIVRRLGYFRSVGQEGNEVLLSELAFCVCAANSSAKAADRAQRKLAESGLLFSDDTQAISSVLLSSHVRFHKNKAKYLIEARRHLFDQKGLEKAREKHKTQIALRDYLAEEVMGLGYKEASHFLRNIGYADDIAILDRHILKNLRSLGVLRRLPKTLTPKRYKAIERKMARFSRQVRIPFAHLDLLFWSEETGRIFK
ncbi:MAG: N-glycosylase/DNA lyase [Candidatus Micrarchaeota archaeon]|nr:N-glycosylase/DNA lyase [Candidatus Micrarchaeota archaeon]